MVSAQRATAEVPYSLVPAEIAEAASRYQRLKEVESVHLAEMARHNLLLEWTDDVREVVLEARTQIRDAAEARERFRGQVREFVRALRDAREPLSAVLRHTRVMVHLLEQSGAIRGDDGWLEAEVLEWAIQEYENAA
ncbi:MAG TPA: hypothetical protein VHB25_10295 [Gemmatimonadaceae bacterium]|nr:hypothetical protein [Gemmatimonadaceae bacterium]